MLEWMYLLVFTGYMSVKLASTFMEFMELLLWTFGEMILSC